MVVFNNNIYNPMCIVQDSRTFGEDISKALDDMRQLFVWRLFVSQALCLNASAAWLQPSIQPVIRYRLSAKWYTSQCWCECLWFVAGVSHLCGMNTEGFHVVVFANIIPCCTLLIGFFPTYCWRSLWQLSVVFETECCLVTTRNLWHCMILWHAQTYFSAVISALLQLWVWQLSAAEAAVTWNSHYFTSVPTI